MIASAEVKARWVGRRFGRLLVKKVWREGDHTIGLCDCDCGRKHTARVYYLGRNTNSCGCLKSETTSARVKKHGQTETRLYRIWTDIKKRCKRHARYSGRGIGISRDWLDFAQFAKDMGHPPSKRHQIDRMNNDGPYSAENCRWATRVTQMRNTSRALYLESDGRRKHLKDWAAETGIKYTTLRYRMKAGWPPADILGIK